MGRLFWRALLCLLCCSLSVAAQTPAAPAPATVAAPATTPTPADVERAKESFRIGAAAYAAGEYRAAIAALDSAYAVAPLPAIAFSLAQAERRQYFVDRDPAHLRRSIALFRRYLDQTPSGGRRTDAIEALAQLEPLAQSPQAAPAPAAPQQSKAPSTRLLIIAEAPGARVFVDGTELSGTLIQEVTPGPHRVTVQAPGFRDAERQVVAVAGELIPVSMTLAELPGMLEVKAPDDAEIYVDGAFASLGGEAVTMALSSGKHRISVAQNGHRVASREVEIQRGGRHSESFTLEPTAQRITSNVLLVGSGAALGVGTFLAVLANQSESSALDFLHKREDENVSEAELVRYRADVQRRDRYRLMAGFSFAASLGMAVTGLFLHELDQPRAEDLNRGGVEVTADVAPERVFLGVRGAF